MLSPCPVAAGASSSQLSRRPAPVQGLFAAKATRHLIFPTGVFPPGVALGLVLSAAHAPGGWQAPRGGQGEPRCCRGVGRMVAPGRCSVPRPMLTGAGGSSGGSHSTGRREESVRTCICRTYAFVYLLYTQRATCRYKHRHAFWISYHYQQCRRRIKYCTSKGTDGIRLHLQTCSQSFVRYLPTQPARKYNPRRCVDYR